MLSDVLFDAVEGIKKYETEFPDSYAGLSTELGVLTTIMGAVRLALDAAPGQSREFDKSVGELFAALRSVDVSGVNAKVDEHIRLISDMRQRN